MTLFTQSFNSIKIKPEEVFSHFKPVDRLADLEPDVIEEYLKQLKKQSH
jgi:hypothetical protein